MGLQSQTQLSTTWSDRPKQGCKYSFSFPCLSPFTDDVSETVFKFCRRKWYDQLVICTQAQNGVLLFSHSVLSLCHPLDCRMPGFPVLHHLLELAQTRPFSQWCHPINSSSVISPSSCLQSFSASGSFPMSQFFTWGGQSTGVSASASVLPMNT